MRAAIAWLEAAVGSTAKVRVLRALSRNPDRWFTEAELARAIGMSPNTVNLALRELVGQGVARLVATGRAHQVSLNAASPRGRAIAELFRSEAHAVQVLSAAVRAALEPGETCVLFGSAARGDMTARSDVDLLIVAPTHDAAAAASVRIGQAARRACPARYNVLHYTPGELRKRWDTPLIRSVRADGVLLGGKPLEEHA